MPPQQSERLLDGFDNGRDFRAHDAVSAGPCNGLCGALQVPRATRDDRLDNYQ
jgi:hypothetical protein